MAKNTKTQTTTQGDPITDFFTPASKPHPQSSTGSRMRISPSIPSLAQASSSGDIRPTGTSETTGALNNSKFASIKYKPLIKTSSKVHSRESLDGSKSSHSTKTSSSKRPLASSAISSKSPDFQAHVGTSTSLNKEALSDTVKISDRRRGKCDSDSDIEMANTVVYVNSTVCHSAVQYRNGVLILISSQSNPKSRKKARLSPAEEPSRLSFLVPSSQSDEEDLVFVKEQAYSPTPTLENDESMEISVDNNLVSEPTTKATSTNFHSRTPNSTSRSTGQMSTPPLTVSAPTPIPLDPATKTAQIIAQIKKRAYAKTYSSPEVAPLEFIDDLDDSDDDSFLPVLPLVTKLARYNIISLPTYQTK